MPSPTNFALVDTRAEYQHLFDIYVPIAIGVFAVVVLLVGFAVLRYRRRPREQAARWHENNRVEGAYAFVLVGAIAYLLFVTFSAEHRVDTVAASEPAQLQVDVTAAKWEWHFNYPAYGIDRYSGSSGDESLVVPTGRAVRFSLVSDDVIHAFWIPQLRYKHDLIPGSVQRVTLVFSRSGSFSGECAEFCGLLHSDMIFTVRALPPAAFDAWARSQQAARGLGASPTSAAPRHARALAHPRPGAHP
jgi:cytochrome c oxidase subunit II